MLSATVAVYEVEEEMEVVVGEDVDGVYQLVEVISVVTTLELYTTTAVLAINKEEIPAAVSEVEMVLKVVKVEEDEASDKDETEDVGQAAVRANCTPLLTQSESRVASAAKLKSAVHLAVGVGRSTCLVTARAARSKTAEQTARLKVLTDADIV